MIASRLLASTVFAIPLLHPLDGFAVAPPSAAPSDLQVLVKTLPAPGPRDRAFLDIPSPLLARLAIDPAAIRSVDPGLVCDLSSKVPSMFQATLGRVGQVETTCTPAGWSQGLLMLQDGSSYVTTCGDSGSARVTANLELTVGTHSWHGSADSAPPARALSHLCSGWTKVNR